MQYYLILVVSTGIIAILAIILWAKVRDVSLVLGIALLYYWSLFGAWFIVKDRLGGDTYGRYRYLEAKLFAVHLDDSYILTLILYSMFIVVVEMSLIAWIRPLRKRNLTAPRPLTISHWPILAIAALAGIVSFLVIEPALEVAKETNRSSYIILSASAPTREGASLIPSSFFTIHQFLFQISLLLAALGFVIFCSGKSPRLLAGRGKRLDGFGYLLLLSGLGVFAFVIGQKGDLFFPGISGFLFYLANAQRPKLMLLTCVAVIGIILLGLIDITRSMPIATVASTVVGMDAGQFLNAFQTVIRSNEAFGAHFSLYGVLAHNMGVTYGSSILSLFASVIPRVFWSNRPDTIYSFYVDNVGAAQGQGYSIHHATGWFLNFGIPGIFIGAVLLAGIWVACFNAYLHARLSRKTWRYVLSTLAPWLFVAYIPRLVRGGPEAYKSLILGFLIPTIVLVVASYRWRLTPRTRTRAIGRSV